MKSDSSLSDINRRALISGLALLPALSAIPFSATARAQTTQGVSLGSWNEGPAKQAIFDFVRATTDEGSSKFVPLEERIAPHETCSTAKAVPSHPANARGVRPGM